MIITVVHVTDPVEIDAVNQDISINLQITQYIVYIYMISHENLTG